ncbi:MAG: CRISPR-associated protein Cas4 [Bacilli bacterium]
MYSEDEYLQLSGIQHYCFCKRQWGLIHIDQAWADDSRTIAGDIFHKNADDTFFHEKRGNVIISRSVPVSSSTLGLSGRLDILEFVSNDKGIKIDTSVNRYLVRPVEYKVGHKKNNNWDKVQLCAETMALEEMFNTNISQGFIYYGLERRRTLVEITQELRNITSNLANEMHNVFSSGIVPTAVKTSNCKKCSLFDLCLPDICAHDDVKNYLSEMKNL